MAQITETVYRVCSDWTENIPENEFNDIQTAIDRVPAYGKYTIRLCGNFMDVRELRLREDKIQVTFDGQNIFGIYFRTGAPICQLGDGRTLKFTNITYIRGDLITVRDDSYIWFKDCQNVMTTVDLVSGRYTQGCVCNTKFYGSDAMPAIGIYDSDCRLSIFDSFVKGGTHQPAIQFNVGSDGKTKLKNSIILHSDGVGNDPIQRGDGTFVGIHAYNCVGNEKLSNNRITNYINTNNDNFFDPEITF